LYVDVHITSSTNSRVAVVPHATTNVSRLRCRVGKAQHGRFALANYSVVVFVVPRVCWRWTICNTNTVSVGVFIVFILGKLLSLVLGRLGCSCSNLVGPGGHGINRIEHSSTLLACLAKNGGSSHAFHSRLENSGRCLTCRCRGRRRRCCALCRERDGSSDLSLGNRSRCRRGGIGPIVVFIRLPLARGATVLGVCVTLVDLIGVANLDLLFLCFAFLVFEIKKLILFNFRGPTRKLLKPLLILVCVAALNGNVSLILSVTLALTPIIHIQ
jgi:hypothetical protein